MLNADTLERLARHSKFNPETQCIEWMGQTIKHGGYGLITIDYYQHLVHRVAAWVFFGFDLSSGYDVMHKCDNPRCWSPMHIISCTVRTNNMDMVAKGRARGGYSDVTHCKSGHEFTEENTKWGYTTRIVDGVKVRKKRRACRECSKLATKSWHRRNK